MKPCYAQKHELKYTASKLLIRSIKLNVSNMVKTMEKANLLSTRSTKVYILHKNDTTGKVNNY